MKVWSSYALHPLSLVVMALFRGSVVLGNACHRRMGTATFTVALSNTQSSSHTAAPLCAATSAATSATTAVSTVGK